jgi:hypothetical protein
MFHSPSPTYPFLSEHDFSLAMLQEWNSTARSVPKNNPLFHTLKGLMDTEKEGVRAAFVATHTGDPLSPLQSARRGRDIA